MSEILSLQYKSVFTTPSTTSNTSTPQNTNHQLNNIQINEDHMIQALKNIPTWSAPGPDGITPFFLKTFAEELAPALCLLWRRSLDTGIMPDDINTAFITPLFKAGNKSEAANYRPVALTNHITKAFERVIKQQILDYLIQHQLLNISQHGFTQGRSTLTNQLEYYESLLLLLEHHQYVDPIYLDYSKAFDKCDHNIILRKLNALGIRGNLNNWISAFLKRRQQVVVVQGVPSLPIWCVSGVPQGSVLGPLLFLILMIDITERVKHSILSSFADDTKVWKGISSLLHEVHLQDDLDALYIWADQNNMEFNSKKFQAIRFAETLSAPVYNNDKADPILNHSLINDLGVNFSFNTKMDQHIHITANKGKK